MRKRMALMGGMGFPATETMAGMFRLRDRFLAAHFEVLLVSWDARQEVYNFMAGVDGWRGYAGDSLGAGSAGEYPDDIHGMADFAAGFQPSDDDARTKKLPDGSLVQVISAKIIHAHCIYDPVWIDTVGLGQTRWVTAPGSATKLLTTEHRGAHPDDWGYSQDMVFNQAVALANG